MWIASRKNRAATAVALIGVIAAAVVLARVPVGRRLIDAARESRSRWELRTAISYYDWASRLGVDRTRVGIERALCLQLAGQFAAARIGLEEVIRDPDLDLEARAVATNALGISYFNENQPEPAIASHAESAEIARNLRHPRLEAAALIGLARVEYHLKGQFESAQRHLEDALRIGRAEGDEKVIADAQRNLGVVLWWGKSEVERPLTEFYEPALSAYRRLGDRHGESSMLSNIGLIHSFRGDLYAHLNFQESALAIREEIGDEAGIADSFKLLGSAYLGVGNVRKAREFFEKSFQISSRIGYRLNQNEAETYLAGSLAETGDFDGAIRLFTNVYERERESPELAKNRLASIGSCYLFKGDLNNAQQVYESVLAAELRNGRRDERTLSAAYVFLAETHMRLGDRENARRYLAGAAELNRDGRALVRGTLSYYVTQAEFSIEGGDPAGARQFLSEAADVESELFANSGTNVVNSPHRRDYDRLFNLLFGKLNDPELGIRFLENRRFRSFRNFVVRSGTLAFTQPPHERFGKSGKRLADSEPKPGPGSDYSELENRDFRFRLSHGIVKVFANDTPPDPKILQSTLDADTALVEYVFAGENVYVAVMTREGVRGMRLPVTRASLENKTLLLRSRIMAPGGGDEWRPISASIHAAIVAPLFTHLDLETVSRIAIVPDGILHQLPFAALVGADGRFLIESLSVFFPPAAAFLAGRTETRKNSGLIAFGIDEIASMKRLEFAETESGRVAEMFAGTAYLGRSATESEFKRRAPTAGIVHLSTHGIAESEMPLLSRLILVPEGEEDGILTVRELLGLGLEARLVTIAACEGAMSFDAGGGEILVGDRAGLTEAFLYAGSENVLASLAPVSDEATLELMVEFYKNYGRMQISDSLSTAQRSFLNGRFQHPRYWSFFTLSGKN